MPAHRSGQLPTAAPPPRQVRAQAVRVKNGQLRVVLVLAPSEFITLDLPRHVAAALAADISRALV